jgi:predicted HAD superfamily Cof-like phosphohydrolase
MSSEPTTTTNQTNNQFANNQSINEPNLMNLVSEIGKIAGCVRSVINHVEQEAKTAVSAATKEFSDKIRPQLFRTNFEKVIQFNETAQVDRVAGPAESQSVLTARPALVKSCLALITEEVRELNDAVEANDLTETRDALADILYVVYGMAYRLGIDADRDFALVHESNMTKFCTSEDEAKATVAQYRAKFEAGNSPYDTPAYRRATTCENLWIVFNESTGKVLKNMNYKPVDLSN